MKSSTLFLSDRFSDIKLKIIGSDESLIIPAHWSILIQNSEYFEGKYNYLISGNDKDIVILDSTFALIVDISEIGTLQDGLDVLQIFYLSFGKFVSIQDNFIKLNSAILKKFLFKDIEFVEKNIFSDIEFKKSDIEFKKSTKYNSVYKGVLEGIEILDFLFADKWFIISNNVSHDKVLSEKYIKFVEELKEFLEKNDIDSHRSSQSGYENFGFTYNPEQTKNVNILFDKLKERLEELGNKNDILRLINNRIIENK